MPVPKGVRYGGRQKGSLNKATIEKRALIERVNIVTAGRLEQAKDALLRIAQELEEQAKHMKLEERLNWLKLTAWCYKAAADFQSPKMLGIAVAPPPPVLSHEPEVIRLRVFEGGRDVTVIDQTPDAA
jgi:hypothetical protein